MSLKNLLSFVFSSLLLLRWKARALVFDFERDFGAIPDDGSHETCKLNSRILSSALQYNISSHTLVIPVNKTFHMANGVDCKDLQDARIVLNGVLRFERLDKKEYRKTPMAPCIHIGRGRNITLTSDYRGLIDGRGSEYWGVPFVGYIQYAENRPRLLVFNRTTDLLIENVILQDSPYHTLFLRNVNRVEVRNVSIVARRTTEDGHGWIDLSAFNTDGIDVSGHNVHVHDVDIWTQDDCIAVKDQWNTEEMDFVSSNMTFERINASGLGLTIGSIGGSTVRNITFRDSYMHRTVKGIYLKFRNTDDSWRDYNLTGLIEDVVFENISMEAPLQFSIFLGPAQQSDNRNPCYADPCSLCWPWSPTAKCYPVSNAKFRNITLRNVQINNPKMSPGVILGNDNDPMESIVFDNVRVTKGKALPYAMEDRTVTFPGLKQPVNDKYVPGHWPTGDADTLFELWSKSLAWNSMQSPLQERSSIHADRYGRNLMKLAWVYVKEHVISSRLGWNPFGRPKWMKTNSYFRCQGATGLAKGNTWPLPGCFENESDRSVVATG